MVKTNKRTLVFVLVAVTAVGLLAVAACSKKEEPAPTAVPAPVVLTADPIYAVLGQADADVSGAADIQIGEDGVTVNYHYYLADEQDFDKTFGPHIAPKIRDLYAKVKEVNAVSFDVSVAGLGTEVWKPRLHFAVDRKLMEETDWTNLLDVDFFKVVKDLQVFD